jgi:lipopolysaccharide transport system ATP-binding protein
VDRFWALRNVSFTVAAGHMLGVIGANGAGKSTLLSLVGRVMRPDQGLIQLNGRVGGLLDLGADFHPDLTGRENVFTSAIIGGLTHHEVSRRFASIVDFAQLEAFIDSPLRTYSLGMRMRLAFAVMVHLEPEILLIDEVLAVGDISFQQKCLERINQFKQKGCAILFVSHDAETVRQFCDEGLWLQRGQVAAHGRAATVVERYLAAMATEDPMTSPSHQLGEPSV